MTPAPLKSILKGDYFSLLSLLGATVPPALWIAGVLFGVLPGRSGDVEILEDDRSFYLALSASFAIVSTIFLVKRVRGIRSLLAKGESVVGTIVYARRDRDRGRVEFEYEYRGTVFRRGMAVHYSEDWDFQKGEPVELAVDPENPKRALIVEVFD